MNRHERLKAKAKTAEKKIDPARAREAEELRKVIGFTKTLTLSGVAISLIGCLLNVAIGSEIILWVLAAPGLLLAIIGYFQNYRKAVCPSCGTFLGAKPTMAKKLPARCPYCGRKWE